MKFEMQPEENEVCSCEPEEKDRDLSSQEIYVAALYGNKDVLHNEYDSMLGGGGHPLLYMSKDDRKLMIDSAWRDKKIDPYQLRGVLSDVTLSDSMQLVEDVSRSVLDKFEEKDAIYFDQARALDVMIELELSSDGGYAVAEDLGEVDSLRSVITKVAETSENYMLALRAKTFLLESDDMSFAGDSMREQYGVFSVAHNVAGYFDHNSDRLRIFQLEEGEQIPDDAFVEGYVERAMTPTIEALRLENREDAKEFLYDYECMMRTATRDVVEKDLGIDMKSLEINEQVWLMQFLKETKNSELDRYREFFAAYGTAGARCFLSLEHGGREMGDKIFSIDKQYDKETAQRIFEKYGTLASLAQDIENIFAHEEISSVQRDVMQEHLLLRGKKILEVLAEEGMNDDAVKQRGDRAVHLLERIRENIEATKALVIAAKAEGKTFNELKSIHIETISESSIGHVRQAYEKSLNAETEEMQNTLLEKFDENIKQGAKIYGVMNQDELVASLVVAEENDGDDVRISALVGDELYGELNLGNYLLKTTIAEKQKHYDHVYGDAALVRASTYIGRFDAIGSGVLHYGGEPSIEVDFGKRHQYIGSGMRKKDAMKLCGTDQQDVIRVVQYGNDTFPERELQEGYVITNIFIDRQSGTSMYVCEREQLEAA